MEKVQVKVINKSSNPLPVYETARSAGMDVKADLSNMECESDSKGKYYQLLPGQRVMIKTGIYVAIPEGYEIQVRPRSGLAIKNGIMVVNSPGTIDSDYRGECNVLLLNTDQHSSFVIRQGDRIAQFLLKRVEQLEWYEVAELNETLRGAGGFGSTGK